MWLRLHGNAVTHALQARAISNHTKSGPNVTGRWLHSPRCNCIICRISITMREPHRLMADKWQSSHRELSRKSADDRRYTHGNKSRARRLLQSLRWTSPPHHPKLDFIMVEKCYSPMRSANVSKYNNNCVRTHAHIILRCTPTDCCRTEIFMAHH